MAFNRSKVDMKMSCGILAIFIGAVVLFNSFGGLNDYGSLESDMSELSAYSGAFYAYYGVEFSELTKLVTNLKTLLYIQIGLAALLVGMGIMILSIKKIKITKIGIIGVIACAVGLFALDLVCMQMIKGSPFWEIDDFSVEFKDSFNSIYIDFVCYAAIIAQCVATFIALKKSDPAPQGNTTDSPGNPAPQPAGTVPTDLVQKELELGK